MKRSKFLREVALHWGLSACVSVTPWAVPAVLVALIIHYLLEGGVASIWLACWGMPVVVWALVSGNAGVWLRRLKRRLRRREARR